MKNCYPVEKTVSVWVGVFASENEFDASIDKNVASIININTPIESICEVSYESNNIQISELLKGFSGWESFIEDASAAARTLGVEAANSALVCYYIKCENAPSKWGNMCFIGSFNGQDV